MQYYHLNDDGTYTPVNGKERVSVEPNNYHNSSGDPFATIAKSILGNGGKTLEKIGLYIVGSLTAANVIDPANLKPWILASVAAILTGLHISTPTPKSGPNQL